MSTHLQYLFFLYLIFKKEERIPSHLCLCARHVSNLVRPDSVTIEGVEEEGEGKAEEQDEEEEEEEEQEEEEEGEEEEEQEEEEEEEEEGSKC